MAMKSASKVAMPAALNQGYYLLAAASLMLVRLVSWRLATLVVLLATAAKWLHNKWTESDVRPRNSPPLVPGLPIVGSGHEFRRNAVPFLLDCRRRFGDMFTVRFPLGQRIHFLMNPHYVQQFASTRTFDFHPIQQVVNTNVFHFHVPNQMKMLRHMCKHARLAVDTDSYRFSQHVNRSFEMVVEGNQSQKTAATARVVGINQFVTETMFRAVFNTVYGDCDDKAFNYRAVKEFFKPIHRSFIFMWLGLPSCLFPATVASWRAIYAAFPGVQGLMKDGGCNAYIRDCIGKWLDGGWSEETVAGHNMVYLHVYHNNCKIAFWLINNLVHHPEQTAKLVEEIDAAIVPGDSEDGYQISIETLESLPILDSCIQETYRLASGLFLMREVAEDTAFPMEDGQKMQLSKGELVSMYPPSFHRDPAIYADPESFRIDRYAGDWRPTYEGREVRRPVLPYGVLCPGKRLSMLQIKLYTVCMLVNFELAKCQESPQPAQYDFASYGDEILPPVSPNAAMSVKLRGPEGRFTPVTLSEH